MKRFIFSLVLALCLVAPQLHAAPFVRSEIVTNDLTVNGPTDIDNLDFVSDTPTTGKVATWDGMPWVSPEMFNPSDLTDGLQQAVDSGYPVNLGNLSISLTADISVTTDNLDIYGSRAQISYDPSYDTSGGAVYTMFTVDADNVNFYGIDFDMSSAVSAATLDWGIRYLSGSVGGAVHHCTFTNQRKFTLASVATQTGSKGIDVHHNLFICDDITYGGGAVLHSGDNCTANYNTVYNVGDTAISLDNSTGSEASHNRIINTLLDGSYLRSAGALIQIAQGSKGCSATGNYIKGVTQRAIYVFDTVGNDEENIIIRDNIIDGGGSPVNPSGTAFWIETDESAEKIEISGNKLYNPSNSGSTSAFIRSRAREVKIFNNDMNADGVAAHQGILISYDSTAGQGVYIYGNTIKTTSTGIKLSAGDYGLDKKWHIYDNDIDSDSVGMEISAQRGLPKWERNRINASSKVAGDWQYNSYFITYDSDERAFTSINPVQSVLWSNTVPTTGSWKDGDIIYKTNSSAGNFIGWTNTKNGTFSSATDATGDTDGSTGVITGMADTSDFNAGDWVSTSAGFANSLDDGAVPVQILSVDSATQITINDTSDTAETDITVATIDPVFKTFGAITP